MIRFLFQTDSLLRGRFDSVGRTWPHLLGSILLFGIFYGAVMGAFGAFLPVGVHGHFHRDLPRQMLYSGLKVPMLLLVTFVLSLPSFFVVNTVLGLRGDFGQVLRGLAATQAGLTTVLAALGPLTAFWYWSVPDYDNALAFNAAMFGIASLAAQWVLRRSYRPLIAANPRHRFLLRAWMVIYAFVGIQMAWVLRPFIGSPHSPTGFFRADAWGNAYVELAHVIGRALGF